MSRGLFILTGECFREGRETTRVIDTDYGLQMQQIASKSHMDLVSQLNTLGYIIDIVIDTRETKYKDLLLNSYKNIIVSNFAYVRTAPDWMNVVNDSIKLALSNIDKELYDFIFICRLDLLLKESLIRLFDPSWNTIMYPNMMHIDNIGAICISDVFCFIPKKYFNRINEWSGLLENSKHLLHHHAIHSLMNNGLKLVSDINFISDKLYIANTRQMCNPLYAIVARPEGPEFYPGFSNKRYIIDEHRIVDM